LIDYKFASRRILEFLRSELAMCGCVLYRQHDNTGVVEFISGCIPGVIEGHVNPSLNVIADAVSTGRCAPIVPDVTQSAYKELDIFQDFEAVSIVAMPVWLTLLRQCVYHRC